MNQTMKNFYAFCLEIYSKKNLQKTSVINYNAPIACHGSEKKYFWNNYHIQLGLFSVLSKKKDLMMLY